MTTTQNPAQDVSDAAIAQAFNEYLDVHYGNKGADVVMTEIWERAKALTAQECVTGIADAVLLRSLCEDVPDMHHSVRTQLQALADKIDSGAKIGVTRCRRCGDKAEVTIHESRSKPPRTEMADEALMAEKTQREMNEFKNDPLPPLRARELQQAQPADVWESYKTWPADIRAKLSCHDLRRMSGWAAKSPIADWRIDTSAGGPILVYQNCSVIESEQAQYVLNLIAQDQQAELQQAQVVGEARQDLRSCTICGLTVDLTKGHVAPSGDFSTAGQPHATRSRKSTAKGDAP